MIETYYQNYVRYCQSIGVPPGSQYDYERVVASIPYILNGVQIDVREL